MYLSYVKSPLVSNCKHFLFVVLSSDFISLFLSFFSSFSVGFLLCLHLPLVLKGSLLSLFLEGNLFLSLIMLVLCFVRAFKTVFDILFFFVCINIVVVSIYYWCLMSSIHMQFVVNLALTFADAVQSAFNFRLLRVVETSLVFRDESQLDS